MAKKLFDLGFSGVTRSAAFEEDGKIILVEQTPGTTIDEIVKANKEDINYIRNRPKGSGVLGARIPITLHHKWKQEWKLKGKKWGIPWHRFLKRKLNSAEYKHLRFLDL